MTQDGAADIERVMRRLDRLLLARGWHTHADSTLFYVGRTDTGRLYAQKANVPDLDSHPTLTSPEVLHILATESAKAGALPIAAGMAFSSEGYQASVAVDAPLHEMDQWHAAMQARQIHQQPGAVEVRVISVVMCDGTEATLVRERDGEVRFAVDRQAGLVFRSLRLLCGLPEDDPEWAKDFPHNADSAEFLDD